MGVAVFTTLVALFLGFGAVQEFIVRGLRNGELQPAVIGIAGAVASLLILVAGIAYARRNRYAPRLCVAAAVLSLAVHGYGALPPHVNVGRLALLVALISTAVLVLAARRRPGEPTVAGGAARPVNRPS